MKQSLMPRKNLIGIGTRTKNADEMDENGKIPALWGKFVSEVLPKLKRTEDFIYAVYKDYESDENGEYFYFIGIPSDEKCLFETVQLPEGRYLELSSFKGKIPEIIVELWQNVWSNLELKNRRAFKVDYEIYPMDFSTNPETQVLLFLSDKF
ncbi:GyrI-like domain-containing protein [Leptospira borgpetersenii]|uniref:GyrI-like small molecule binding domain protein n=1 Tax=Leptospira borgpetersenii serovar Ballum TaxID=280505 RepID=A0A0E3BL48_LEPBO|nr:effector binding domain-containing protein [Leptospira borgpetersenii]EMO11610.1 GyrI-like small molecule binding domain protein [Leptospira borgpetersenii str. Noumea 25]ALO26403.1 GyrI-like small molecule binding domain protein [Leptospira borgpetersenii serovar Ballum]ANH01042.1 GyrI-like small molecule binding domain protein [Leptospira borgpetersenii str. 4E]EKR00349.1 GyrI-like small molecule binding domain protein [Leptospira borgpetersenii serovar Castellonis str. 200801910]KGE22585